jgi:hypothetical protein
MSFKTRLFFILLTAGSSRGSHSRAAVLDAIRSGIARSIPAFGRFLNHSFI